MAMTLVTVFRRVPSPIVGTLGVIQSRDFLEFEELLDWLESFGVLVERFDVAKDVAVVTSRPSVRDALVAEGERCLPLVLANDRIVLRGGRATRTQLARAVGGRGPCSWGPDEAAERPASGGKPVLAGSRG
jgi:hypothetical protein